MGHVQQPSAMERTLGFGDWRARPLEVPSRDKKFTEFLQEKEKCLVEQYKPKVN
jgi:hypothetical protein